MFQARRKMIFFNLLLPRFSAWETYGGMQAAHLSLEPHSSLRPKNDASARANVLGSCPNLPSVAICSVERRALGMQAYRKYFPRAVPQSRNIQATVLQPGVPNRSCTVSDISDAGAKITVVGNEPIPSRFELALGDGQRRVCKPIWCCGRTAGLRFTR
jgi:hypothetical protein